MHRTREDASRNFPAPLPLDLRLTLSTLSHGPFDPTIRAGATEAWRASRTPEGPATLHLVLDGEELRARAWGPGAHLALDGVPDLVGAGDDLAAFAPRHRLLRVLAARYAGLRMTRSRAVVEALIPTVVTQKVTNAEAHRAYNRILMRYGGDSPGPAGLLLPPDPAELARLPYYEFHTLGVERRRAERLSALCARAARLERIAWLPPGEARAELLRWPGIGPWTADHVVRAVHGDADAVITGDYHLPHTVSWALAREPRGTDAKMLELLAPFGDQRGRAQRLIELGCPGAPSFGPKRPLRRLERI